MAREIFPGYFISKPLFQSIKTLRRLLAEQDSCFQANQISISFLEDYIRTNDLDNARFIESLCQKFNISGGQRNWATTKALMAKSYVVQTYNVQEVFFKDFNDEYRSYKNFKDWKYNYHDGNSTKSLDPYSQLLENLPKEQANRFKDSLESQITRYYRLVRNWLVHPSDKTLEKATRFYEVYILPNAEYFNRYYKFIVDDRLPAPNGPSSLNHYDFTIYSRCLKYLANLINDSCDLTVEEIFNFEISDEDFVKRMNQYNPKNDEGTKLKLISELSNFFNFKYGRPPGYADKFVNQYFYWLQR